MEKTLSIIIPTYNMEKYLRRCLDSLSVSSTPERLEVIVVNDGSKDSSLSIAREYEAKYPGIFRTIDKPNGNYGSCINRGLREATGKYVKILDADDWFDTMALEELLDVMSGIDVDLVVSDYMLVLDDDHMQRRGYGLPARVEVPVSECFDIAGVGMFEMHAIAYRRENLLQMGYRQSEGISYTDLEWATIPMSTVGRVFYFNKPVYQYFIGREGNTMSVLYTPKWLRQALIVRKAMVESIGDGSRPVSAVEEYKCRLVEMRLRDMYLAALMKGGLNDDALREFDDYLRHKNKSLYDAMADVTVHDRFKYRFVKAWRKNGRVSPVILSLYRMMMKVKR